jgi:hypothetical protein
LLACVEVTLVERGCRRSNLSVHVLSFHLIQPQLLVNLNLNLNLNNHFYPVNHDLSEINAMLTDNNDDKEERKPRTWKARFFDLCLAFLLFGCIIYCLDYAVVTLLDLLRWVPMNSEEAFRMGNTRVMAFALLGSLLWMVYLEW